MSDPGATETERIEIVLADDHTLVRTGLRQVLEAEPDLTVVAEAGDVDGALRETRAHQPRIILLDLNMPGAPTLPAIPQFLDAAPASAVIVLTMESDPVIAREAITAGAHGYVLKDATMSELVDAVRVVAGGRTYLDPSLGARLVSSLRQPAAAVPGLSESDPELAVGTIFAGHRIDSVVGRGGMGLVFLATDLALDRRVALKVIAPRVANDPLFRARFVRECRLAAAIDHPHAVEIFHAGEEQGLLYLTMRYVDGTDLRRMLRREGRLEPPRAVAIVEQIADALDEAHQLGLIHRDVQPANVLIAQRYGRDHAFLTDFGISKPISEHSLTQTGAPVGTVDYVAPEQALGVEVDRRADVYSLGCVLFHTLTGAVLFEHDSDLEKLWAHVHVPPPRLLSVDPELPHGLEDVLDRALAKAPEQRQQSAGELAHDASAALRSD